MTDLKEIDEFYLKCGINYPTHSYPIKTNLEGIISTPTDITFPRSYDKEAKINIKCHDGNVSLNYNDLNRIHIFYVKENKTEIIDLIIPHFITHKIIEVGEYGYLIYKSGLKKHNQSKKFSYQDSITLINKENDYNLKKENDVLKLLDNASKESSIYSARLSDYINRNFILYDHGNREKIYNATDLVIFNVSVTDFHYINAIRYYNASKYGTLLDYNSSSYQPIDYKEVKKFLQVKNKICFSTQEKSFEEEVLQVIGSRKVHNPFNYFTNLRKIYIEATGWDDIYYEKSEVRVNEPMKERKLKKLSKKRTFI